MFEIGKIYNRRSDIHNIYKGQQYGGIATPAEHPYIFIFTGDAGGEYGYIDDFDPNGTFKYTGEGHLEFNNKLINKVAAIEAKLIE